MSRSAVLLILIAASAVPSAQSELVIHKEGTTSYHQASCPAIKDGVGVILLSRGQAEARGWKQHPECDPEKVRQQEEASLPKRSPSPPEFVHVDGSKYYHREKCRNLNADNKRSALEDAGKKYWPCPVCKPPIRRKSDGPAVPRRAGT
jgi:hypothetical protein